jgi:hypothetical protein
MGKNESNQPFLVFRCFVTIFMWLSGTALLWGQEKGYRIEGDGHFVQLLHWEAEDSALYYEVEIEKQTGRLWKGALIGTTEESFFEFSLEPGIYRYRIRPYDLLEHPGRASDWIHFAILPSRQPELLRFSPEAFYLHEDTAWVITISGRNLMEGLEVFLRESQGGLIKPEKIILGPSQDEVRLAFAYRQLAPGEYAIHVTNPGGLTAEAQPFRIAFGKPADITVSAGYRPMAPLYGSLNRLFGMFFTPAGVYARLGVIPVKQRWGQIGFEVEPSWNYVLAAGAYYGAHTHMPGAAIYGMYRLRFANLALGFRIGGGIYSTLNYYLAFSRWRRDPPVVLIPAFAAGASVQWFVTKPFFVEAGLDFSNFFTPGSSSGYLRPSAGLGWRF